ncbi:D-alanine--D-alanine ligase family protein [Haliangium sp.]|uniref:D-alanine--D-alanine ligase family protein n=1 Tax=Haliangium sp. TaxID=2663208 RepID=UPI003D1484D1
MKVAFTHNLRLTDSEREAEFDTAETVDAIAKAIEAAGHEVEKIEVSGPASNLLERIENIDPDIIFNTAEGSGGRMREAFYPALFEELGVPYTGSDAYAMALTLDKWLTKLVIGNHGIDTPRAALVTPKNLDERLQRGLGLAFPVIVKPNYEGSSKGIADDSVAKDAKDLTPVLKAALREYPDGVLIEEYIDGIDVAVGYIDGVGHDSGLLMPVEHLVDGSGERPFNIYDYRLKNLEPGRVHLRCPANIPRDVAARLRSVSLDVVQVLGLRDLARLDYRIADDGRIYLLEANALPALNRSSSIFVATSQLGLTYDATVAAVLNAAALRANVATASELGLRRRRRNLSPIRVGFTYNVKRDSSDPTNDDQAEWDPPETIIAISNALARQGHIVVHLEATPDLPRVLAEADVDLIFNIAEGVEGRNREAQVPALCELLNIPYTGSDSATLAIALDKALCKKVLMQHDILTPKFQVMETGRERLDPALCFPLIVKPNAEGSSKGIGNTNVVDDEESLRAAVRSVLNRYRQPAIIEEYISGREFTVGLLGDKRPRVLPAMEIRFKDPTVQRPVYDFVVKQAWEQHVYYECPAKLTDTERKNIEKIARDTFWALDCRDVARADLRMDDDGRIYVLEVNPLPGLTPGYSDLVLISQAAGMDYDQLMAEIMLGGLRRLREKRREEREERRAAASARANGNGGESVRDERAQVAATKMEKAAERAEKAAERAEKAARKLAQMSRKPKRGVVHTGVISRAPSAHAGNGNGNGAHAGNGNGTHAASEHDGGNGAAILDAASQTAH